MPNQILASRYAVQKVLGEGGFGQTFLVADRLQADLPRVVKVFKNIDGKEALREFEILQRLYHPHIVEAVGFGIIEEKNKTPYLVMEYVEGQPLDADDWDLIAQVCRTLSYLHSQKIVHGDLKPENILVGGTPRTVKLLDFGLSALRNTTKKAMLPAGTLAYMAPETISKGIRSPQSDLYALGMILLKLLQGRLPFSDRSEAALRFHLREEPDLSFLKKHPWAPALEKILSRLLHKEPAKRFHDALEVLNVLNTEAKAGLAVHRGWLKTDDEGLFVRKLDDYLKTVDGLLQLPSVRNPRSFLEEEERRIEKYLSLAEGLSTKEKSDWVERLHVTKARLLIQEGRYEDALKVKGISDALKNIHGLAWIYRERHDQAEPLLSQVAKQSSNRSEKARATNYLGMITYQKGDWTAARERFESALEQTTSLKESLGIVSNSMNLGAVAQQEGRVVEALKRYREALTAAETLHNSYLLAILLSNLANLHIMVGDVEEARRHLERSSSLAGELNLPLLMIYNGLLEADLVMWQRDFTTADAKLAEVIESLKQVDAPMYAALAWINRAENALRARLWEDAASMTTKASQAAAKTDLPEIAFRLDLLKTRLHLLKDQDRGAAEKALQRLEKKATAPKERFHIAVAKAQLALASEDSATAEDAIDAAQEFLDEELAHIPVGYRTRVTDAPRFHWLWEAQNALKRAKGSTGDSSLWHLIEINKRLTAQKDPRPLYGLILDAAIDLLHAERGFLIMPEYGKWKRGSWKVQVARNFRQTDLPGGRDLLSQRVIDKVLKSHQPLLIHNAQGEDAFRDFRSVKALKLQSILAAPIHVHGEMIGALYLDHTKTTELFSEKDQDILKAFADQAGMAIHNARMHDESERQRRALEEARTQLESANAQLEDELKKKSEWVDKIEDELKKFQATGPFVARSAGMKHIARQLPALGKSRAPVVVCGEPGTGKDLLAKLLHQEAGGGLFVGTPCQKLPRQKTEGAGRDALGELIDQAKGGTLYLDEISDLPAPYQRELLALIEAQESRKDRSVFVILSSRARLKDLSQKDLVIPELQRFLSGSEVHLPPLRDRKEDIGPLAQHILQELKEKHGMDRDITRGAKAILHDYDWPGNVRELELELERSARSCYSTIGPFDLSPNLLNAAGFVPGASKKEKMELHEQRGQFERDTILQALEKTGWNKVRAAKRLGLSRAMLYVKIQKYQIPLK